LIGELQGEALRVTCGWFREGCELSRSISSAVGSRPIACRKLRQVRKILLKAAMVATDKWPSIIVPRLCRKYDLTWIEQQDSGLFAGFDVHRMVAVPLPEPVQCDRDGGLFRRATKGPARTGGAKSSEDVRVTR
jgi:hypothetical protein